MKILVEDIVLAQKKSGEPVSGTSSKGTKWTLYKVNGKYSYFHYGDDELDISENIEYDFIVDTNEKGTTIKLPFNKKIGTVKEKPQEKPESKNRALELLESIDNTLRDMYDLLNSWYKNEK